MYEDHERFTAFPTFPIVLPFKGTSHDVVPFPSPTLFSFPPGLPVMNPAMTLHAEQVRQVHHQRRCLLLLRLSSHLCILPAKQAIYILAPLSTDGAVLTAKSKITVSSKRSVYVCATMRGWMHVDDGRQI